MATKQANQKQVSVRGTTYDKLRAYCRKHGENMRSVVDGLVNQALDAAEKKQGN